MNQEVAKLNTSIDELTPWTKLNTSIKNLNSFEQTEVNMGTIPKKLREKLQSDLLKTQYTYLEIVSEDKDNLYILILFSNSEAEMVMEILRNNSFSKIKLNAEGIPAEETSKLNNKISAIETEIKSYEQEIAGLSSNLPEMEIVYDYLMNKKLRIASSEKFLMTESINVIKGYIPSKMAEEFTDTVRKALNKYYYKLKSRQGLIPCTYTIRNSKFAKS